MSNRHFQRRVQFIEMEPMDDSSDNNSNHTWLQEGINSMQLKRSEMNALIMDYLVHEGFKEAAERFREEAGIEPTNMNFDFQEDASSNHNHNHQNKISTNNTNSSSNNNNVNSNTIASTNTAATTSSSSNSHVNNNTNNNNSRRDSLMNEDTIISDDDDVVDNNKKTNNNINGSNHVNNNSNDCMNWLTKSETPEMMDKRVEIRHLIEEGDILKGQSLINLYYPELLDNHRNLYFKLQQQHLIELIRQQKINEVLSYVHDQLSVDELRDLTEMERTLALLAYENPDKSPYANLLHPSHRLQLASEMNDIILKETTGNIEPTKPRLVTLLKLLFWTQSELERKKIQFPKMTDLVNGTIVETRFS